MSTKHKGKADTQAADPDGSPISLAPNSAVSGDPADIVMVVAGEGFTADSVIFFNGLPEPTTVVSATQVSTGVKPSLFVVPAVCPVHVETDGVATQAADFTFVERVEEPPAIVPDEVLEAQLRAWGLSGEPVSWAFDQWQPAIVAIRAANLGFGEVATAQGMLDALFPLNTLDATKVCVDGEAAANAEVSEKTKDGVTTLSTKAKGVDPAAFSWFVDGTHVGSGPEAEAALSPGEHLVEVQIAIAGTVFSHRKEITVEPKKASKED